MPALVPLAHVVSWIDQIHERQPGELQNGGPPNLTSGAGLANIQAQQLASRTAWLKQAIGGLGGTATAVATLAGVVTTGLYRYSSADPDNPVAGSGGTVLHIEGNGGYASQLLTSNAGGLFVRRRTTLTDPWTTMRAVITDTGGNVTGKISIGGDIEGATEAKLQVNGFQRVGPMYLYPTVGDAPTGALVTTGERLIQVRASDGRFLFNGKPVFVEDGPGGNLTATPTVNGKAVFVNDGAGGNIAGGLTLNGAIVPSSTAKLQVNGFQRTGAIVIYPHQGDTTSNPIDTAGAKALQVRQADGRLTLDGFPVWTNNAPGGNLTTTPTVNNKPVLVVDGPGGNIAGPVTLAGPIVGNSLAKLQINGFQRTGAIILYPHVDDDPTKAVIAGGEKALQIRQSDGRLTFNGSPVWTNTQAQAARGNAGYMALPDGSILQWGASVNSGPSGYAEATFPIAFPNACLCVVSNERTTAGVGAAGVRSAGWLYDVTSTTSTAFRVVTQAGNAFEGDSVSYFAIGW